MPSALAAYNGDLYVHIKVCPHCDLCTLAAPQVCDFGFAKNWDTESNMFTQIGTPVYMSPQLISAKTSQTGYDAVKADVWACGVLLFVMLHGMFPYDHPEHPDPNSSDAHVEVRQRQVCVELRFVWR